MLVSKKEDEECNDWKESMNKKRGRSPSSNRNKASIPKEGALKKARVAVIDDVDPVLNATDLNETEIVIESAMNSISATKSASTRAIAVHSVATKSSANDLKLDKLRSIRKRKPEWFESD